MWEGLVATLVELISPFIHAFKLLFCWIQQALIDAIGILLGFATFWLPSWSVPSGFLDIFEALNTVFLLLNWVLPLGLLGSVMAIMFYFYVTVFTVVPAYRAVMDLL